MTIKVLLVDDDALVRAGLRIILSSADDLEVVGEIGDGSGAVAAVLSHRPDIVLMDIRMAEMDGITATTALRLLAAPPQIIVLTTFQADEQVISALRAGASGFLVKDTPPAAIVEAVRRVAAGEPMLSPTVTRQLIAHVAAVEPIAPGDVRLRGARARLDQLSDREREVALAVGRGLSNAQIGAELYLSLATVKAYVSRLLTKLEVDNRVQVALLTHDAELA